MIKIGYLQGYNSFNVPVFNSASARDNFFDNIDNLIEINAYYPPYFTNIIRLSNDEVPQSQPFNFVILVHNNKYYYYFIDSNGYDNEDVYTINIYMDSMLTYMFDFKIMSCDIKRMSIKRWDNGSIKRDYIPENLSSAEFINKDYKEYNTGRFYQINTTEDLTQDSQGMVTTLFYTSAGSAIPLNYTVCLFYMPTLSALNVSVTIHHYNGTTVTKTYNNGSYWNFGFNLTKRNGTQKALLFDCDYSNIFRVEEEIINNVLNINIYEQLNHNFIILSEFEYGSALQHQYGMYLQSCSSELLEKTEYVTYDGANRFEPNNQRLKKFDVKYCPQMLDENYINVAYGEKTNLTSLPLRKFNSDALNLKCHYDFATGSRSYGIFDSQDIYNTFIISLTPLELPLINDAWLSYEATHKSSYTDGYALAQHNNNINMITGVLGSFNSSRGTETFSNYHNTATSSRGTGGDLSSVSAHYSSIANATRGTKDFNTTSFNSTRAASNMINNANAYYNTYKEREIMRKDLEFTPDTVGQSVDLMASIANKSTKPIFAVSVVKDLYNCAKHLENYGYRVEKRYDSDTDGMRVFEIANIRLYYNCLNLENVELKLETFMSETVIFNIKDRLSNGVRLFNINNITTDILNMNTCLYYDNVELEEITNG